MLNFKIKYAELKSLINFEIKILKSSLKFEFKSEHSIFIFPLQLIYFID